MRNFTMLFKTDAAKYVSLNAIGAVTPRRSLITPLPRGSGDTEAPSRGGSWFAGLAALPWARASLASGPVGSPPTVSDPFLWMAP